MTYLDLVATLVDKLDDMIAKLGLHDLGNLVRVSQVECHIGKRRVEQATSHIVHLATLAC